MNQQEFKEKPTDVIGALTLDTVSQKDGDDHLPPNTISPEEIKVNQVLEQLPSFNITHSKSTAKQIKLAKYFWVVGFLSISAIMTLIALYVVHLAGGEPRSVWSVLALWTVGTPLFGVFFCVEEKLKKQLRVSVTLQQNVATRQELIKKAIPLCNSFTLQGRLSELYFLCDHENIDVKFWDLLQKNLEELFQKQEKKASLGDIHNLKSQYRTDLGLSLEVSLQKD